MKQRAAAAERKKRKENWKPRYSIQRKSALYTNMYTRIVRDVLQSKRLCDAVNAFSIYSYVFVNIKSFLY